MTNYMLHRLTKRSNMMMANMLRTHVEFTPPDDVLAGKDMETVVETLPRDTEICKVLSWLKKLMVAYIINY